MLKGVTKKDFSFMSNKTPESTLARFRNRVLAHI
jgi:hypothetical protein